MSDVPRISPEEARAHVNSVGAMLVCAYESDEKFQANHLEAAISFSDFQSRLQGLEKDTELIFYCG